MLYPSLREDTETVNYKMALSTALLSMASEMLWTSFLHNERLNRFMVRMVFSGFQASGDVFPSISDGRSFNIWHYTFGLRLNQQG